MTTNKKKKSRKKRGSGSHGHGGKKKHRGAGSRGGRGRAGTFKHEKIKVKKEDPDHIGKRGFKRPPKVREDREVINVCDLEKFDTEDGEVDLAEMGFDKLLGKGSVDRALEVKVPSFSERAEEKIEEAGGSVTAV